MPKPDIKLNKTQEFENWILTTYSGRIMGNPPEKFDETIEFYYYHKGKQFGPIKIADIPKEYI